MKLYLMRHGETLFNTLNRIQGWCDSPLTEKGQDQARQVRAYFEKHDMIALFHFVRANCIVSFPFSSNHTSIKIIIPLQKPQEKI